MSAPESTHSDESEAVDLHALRMELFDLYDAMSDTLTAYQRAEHRAETGKGTHADASTAFQTFLDAKSALHDRINRIGRHAPPGTTSGGEG